MSSIDLDRVLNEPIYAFDLQFMIGDIQDYLEFSEDNIGWQYRRELQSIRLRTETEDFPPEYHEHLVTNAEHRFKVSLPLRIRYGALVALVTSVEWSVKILVDRLSEPNKKQLDKQPSERKNQTARHLDALIRLLGLKHDEVVMDYEAIVHIRNCIVHRAGLERDYQYQDQLLSSIQRLKGFSLANWHFFGSQVCIEKGALDTYITEMKELVVKLYRVAYENGRLKDND